jgi:hypothetical protein
MAVEIGRESATGQLWRLRCSGCGYGASCRVEPERCPMCGCGDWVHDEWRPFTRGLEEAAADFPLTRDTAA